MSTNDTAVQEHRGHQRIEVSEIIKVVDRQTGNTVGQLVNISTDGLMLLSPEPVPENSIFQLSLEFSADSANTAAALGRLLHYRYIRAGSRTYPKTRQVTTPLPVSGEPAP